MFLIIPAGHLLIRLTGVVVVIQNHLERLMLLLVGVVKAAVEALKIVVIQIIQIVGVVKAAAAEMLVTLNKNKITWPCCLLIRYCKKSSGSFLSKSKYTLISIIRKHKNKKSIQNKTLFS